MKRTPRGFAEKVKTRAIIQLTLIVERPSHLIVPASRAKDRSAAAWVAVREFSLRCPIFIVVQALVENLHA
jgi:hypothetical protein